MPQFIKNMSKIQKALAVIAALMLTLGTIISSGAKAFGLDANDFYIATSNDINKTHLRIAQSTQYTYEKELERLQQKRRDNWQYQFDLEQQSKPVPPQLKEEELETNEEIQRLQDELEELDQEIDERTS